MIPLSYDSAIQKHLRRGERLRWVGRARQGYRYRWRNRIVLVQGAGAILLIVWILRVANATFVRAGMNTRLPIAPPSIKSSMLVLLFALVLGWQLLAEHRRRAGTWYAVTDRRILFVLTSVRPESVIGIDFEELAGLSLNNQMNELGSPNAVILDLKHVDPYLANSSVLGYQMSARRILLEDLEDPQEFHAQVLAAALAHAAAADRTARPDCGGSHVRADFDGS